MSITPDQLDSFHQFAIQLSQTKTDLTWPELFDHWQIHNPSANEQAEIYAALDESLDDMNNGRHRLADEVMAELPTKHNLLK